MPWCDNTQCRVRIFWQKPNVQKKDKIRFIETINLHSTLPPVRLAGHLMYDGREDNNSNNGEFRIYNCGAALHDINK